MALAALAKESNLFTKSPLRDNCITDFSLSFPK